MFKNWTKFQKKKKSFLDVQINFPTFKIKEVGFFSFKGGETFFGAREEDNSSCLALHHNPAKFSDWYRWISIDGKCAPTNKPR